MSERGQIRVSLDSQDAMSRHQGANLAVDVSSWAGSACYLRSTLFRVRALPLTTARSLRPLTCASWANRRLTIGSLAGYLEPRLDDP